MKLKQMCLFMYKQKKKIGTFNKIRKTSQRFVNFQFLFMNKIIWIFIFDLE